MSIKIVSLAACVVIITAFWSSNAGSAADGVRPIPPVIGMKKGEAVSTLSRAGFRPHIGVEYTCEFPRDVIARQQPPAGVDGSVGSVVIILENQSGGFKMPDLTGKSYEEASNVAKELGFSVTLDESAIHMRTDISGTCDTPSETWSAIQSQLPPRDASVCLQGGKAVALTRIKLLQKKLSERVCNPPDRDPCRRHRSAC